MFQDQLEKKNTDCLKAVSLERFGFPRQRTVTASYILALRFSTDSSYKSLLSDLSDLERETKYLWVLCSHKTKNNDLVERQKS